MRLFKKIIKYAIAILFIAFLPGNIKVIIERVKSMLQEHAFVSIFEMDTFKIQNTLSVLKENFIDNFLSFIHNFSSFESFKSMIITNLNGFIGFIGDNLTMMALILNSIFILFLFLEVYIICFKSKSYRISLFTRLLIYISSYLAKCYKRFKQCLKVFYKEHALGVKLYILFIFALSGFLELFIFEFFVFVISFLFHTISFTSYNLLFSILSFLLYYIYMFLSKFPLWIVLLVVFAIGTKILFMLTWRRLQHLYDSFKCFIKFDTAVLNVVNGAPSAGKTLFITQAGLASEENFIEELEKSLLEFEIKYPNFNMAYIRLLSKIYCGDFSETEFNKIVKKCPDILLRVVEIKKLFNSNVYADFYFKLYYRGSMTVSSVGMVNPYWKREDLSTTHHLDFNSIRFYKKQTNMFHEEYENLVIPEFDKEYNSHDSKDDASEDGAPAFFAIFSHIVKRNGKVFIDYQDKAQGLRRIRAIAGFFMFIEKKIYKMPFFIKCLNFLPSLLLGLNVFFIKQYLGYKPKTEKKWTLRKKQFIYNNNKLSLLYYFLKVNACFYSKIIMYLNRFSYFKFIAQVATTDEFTDSKRVKYSIPLMNLTHEENNLYESCQFNAFYGDLRNALDSKNKGLKNLSYWSSIDPGAIEYLEYVKQRFYTKIVKAQFSTEENVAESGDAI